jgi:hypothetical protein
MIEIAEGDPLRGFSPQHIEHRPICA